MCQQNPAGLAGGTAGSRSCSVRVLARALVAAQRDVPGLVLEFGQRRAGEIVLRQPGVKEGEAIMWPITLGPWPFIADTKPAVIGSEEGTNCRWGLDAVQVVQCEIAGAETRLDVLAVRSAIQQKLSELGIPCVALPTPASYFRRWVVFKKRVKPLTECTSSS